MSSDSSLRMEDFDRLQNQVLDLREKNCTLEDTLRKQKKELSDTKVRLQSVDESSNRIGGLLNSVRRNGEVELLRKEKFYLMDKIKDQEDEFRLQQAALMNELTRLVGENERLESHITTLCGEKDDLSDGDLGSTDDSKEVVRLRSELCRAQKTFADADCHHHSETSVLKKKTVTLSNRVSQLTEMLKVNSIAIDEGEVCVSPAGDVAFKKFSVTVDDTNQEIAVDDLSVSNAVCTESDGEMEQVHKNLAEPSIQLELLLQEKEQLVQEKEQLVQTALNEKLGFESSLSALECRCQELNGCLGEKISSERKLQEHLCEVRSGLDLQASEFQTTIDKQTTHVTDLQHLLIASQQKFSDLQLEKQTLAAQMESAVLSLEKKLSLFEDNNNELKRRLSEVEQILLKVRQENSALQDDLNECTRSLKEVHNCLDDTKNQLIEKKKLSESRRMVIEQMKDHYQEEIAKHVDEKENILSELETRVSMFVQEKSALMNQLSEANKKAESADALEKDLLATKESAIMQQKIRELEDEVKLMIRRNEEDVGQAVADFFNKEQELMHQWEVERRDFTTQLEICNIQKQELDDVVSALNKQVSESEEEKKIHERKGATLLKDLKKQVASERKRADRLQEKMTQLLADPSQLTAMNVNSDPSDDVSSVSSWSMVSGDQRDSSTRENSFIVSPLSSPGGPVGEDTTVLLARISELQLHKWQLEERLSHLELSSAAMAEDLLKKSAVIQHYCMDLKGDAVTSVVSPIGERTGVRKVLETLRGARAGDADNLKEVNRCLQSLLEEALTKNIHLHTDVDHLSEQVHQLSQLAAQVAEEEASV